MTGDKMECRRVMIRSSVPVTPGGDKVVEDVNEALSIAEAVGFPVLMKSAFGGGGRGIRVARNAEELRQFFDIAQRESKIAFGKTGIYVERFIADARHIEIQVVFDSKGKGVHLGERECSIQRRYQKLIEMSPSPIVSKDDRQMLGELALKAGKAVAYTNAGTVEFIRTLDGQYYFIEFNTRLQVEHPVTEMVTGVDIVKMQLAIAGGELLKSSHSKLRQNGWAIECRINSEDPSANFLPSAGIIGYYSAPSGPWTRFDTAIYQGYEVTPYYDSLIGKLVVWGPTFEEARIRMLRALGELTIEGIATNISMHQVILNHQSFTRGDFSTRFLEREDLTPKILTMADEERAKLEDEAVSIGAVLTEVRRVKTSRHTFPSNQRDSSWRGVLELKDGRYADGF
jgi:acetyl-CoA/propionyl-CoA carboxylase